MKAGLISTTAELAKFVTEVTQLPPAVDDADRIERVRQFEMLKAAVAAAQIQEIAAFAVAHKAAQATAGVPVSRQGRGIAGQVGLARRCSPWQARRHLGWAGILTTELPGTFAELRAGRTTEWRAILVARETIWLSREDRAAVDAELAPHLEGWGDAQVEAAARRAAYRLDPRGSVQRAANAEADRRVSIRPAPDTMCRLSALLPVVQGVATYAALTKTADTTTAGGDERGRGQIMADTLFERVTGLATAGAVPVEIELVMTDRTLLGPALHEQGLDEQGLDEQGLDEQGLDEQGLDEQDLDDPTPVDDGSHEPGVIVGYGPVPAELARTIARGAIARGATAPHEADARGAPAISRNGPRWLRRLFLHPTTGQLAAMESTRRLFTHNQQRFLRVRDERCRTPWCGAPIRHNDHVRAHAQGGRTGVVNGEGTCAACNIAKQAPGWRSGVTADGTVVIRTPSGHVYRSRLPDPPGERHRLSGVEWQFLEHLAAA